MRYIKLTMQYLYKNFFYVFLVMLVPGIIVGLLTRPCTMLEFFMNFNIDKYQTFADIFLSQSELNSWIYLVVSIVLIPIVMIFVSELCGLESKHMRWGVLNGKEVVKKINNNFLPVFKIVVMFLILMQLYAVICSTMTFMWVKIFNSYVATLTLVIITNVLLFIVLLMCITSVILTLPIMTITGLNMRKACIEALMMIKGNFLKMFFAITIPLIIPYAIMGVLTVFVNSWWIKLINALIYVFIFSYYITLMYVAYCDIADIDREDLKNKYLKVMEG